MYAIRSYYEKIEEMAKLYTLVTGIEMTAEQLGIVAERISTLAKLINIPMDELDLLFWSMVILCSCWKPEAIPSAWTAKKTSTAFAGWLVNRTGKSYNFV